MTEEQTKRLYLFAGINGVGKTSLFESMDEKTDLGKRISIDEIAKSMGDWKDPVVQVRAGCAALKEVFLTIHRGITFNEETTLPGVVIYKQLKEAKKQGYLISLYFVGVEGVETAIDRVHKRIAKGGHGISDEVILKRYHSMPTALARILPFCDLAFFYDNTDMFRQIACFKGSEFVDLDPNLPNWFYYVTGTQK